jgi:hypothetical protein
MTGTFGWAFTLFAVVSLVGAAGSILLRKKIRNSKIIQGQHGFMLIALYMVLRLQLQQGSGTWFRLFHRCRFLIVLTVEYTF